MYDQPKRYIVSAKVGSSGTIRIAEELAAELGRETEIQGRACVPNGHTYPIIINAHDRTLDGLKDWLRSIPEGTEHTSFCIRLITMRPLLIGIALSQESIPIRNNASDRVRRPKSGLYLGRVLEDVFNELVPTQTPFTLDEHDLLTHVFICGVTGAGKTVLGKAVLEEAALKAIPAIAIDLKGDISALALMMTGEDIGEVLPFVHPERSKTQEEMAAQVAEEHKCNLNKWGFNSEFVREAKKNIAVNVFTPRSNDGFRLSLSAFPEPPENPEKMSQSDPDAYDLLLEFLAQQFVARLQLDSKRMNKARGYVFEILKACFPRKIPMQGYDGVKRILDEFNSPHLGIDKIGMLDTSAYISASDREHLANAVNGLLTGARRRMYEGWPVSIEGLIGSQAKSGKTPISVINVAHLEFREQAYVVGYLAHLISFWMRKLPGTYQPRLIFYIDEIAGGGGKEAFFPSVAISPCKPALNRLLRQGRAYGVSCIFATQNPGDIDYKGLSNCDTWMVGRLRTDRDRLKIKQGAADAEIEFESASAYLPSLRPGQFVVRKPGTAWQIIEERWLLSLHRPLSAEELRELKTAYEREALKLLSEAADMRGQNKLSDATVLLRKLISGYPYSALFSKASLELARVLIDDTQFSEARSELEELLKRWTEDSERAEAKFLLGTCHEGEGDFVSGLQAYREAHSLTTDAALKDRSRLHSEYCGMRVAWPNLGIGEKVIWWILGRKAEEGELLELRLKDDTILTQRHDSELERLNLALPPAIDSWGLILSGPHPPGPIDAEIDEWAEEQVARLNSVISTRDLDAISEFATAICRRFSEKGICATSSVLDAVKKAEEIVMERREKVRASITHVAAHQFEYDIARLVTKMGYTARATKISGDDGVDVFATKNGEKLVIQCKRWRKNAVGRAVVDELGGTARRYQATGAVLATTSCFSEDAMRAARELNIELWDFDKLCGLFRKYALGRLNV